MGSRGIDPYEEMEALKREEVDFLSAVAKRAYQSVLRHSPGPIYLRTRDVQPLKKLYVASLAFQLPHPGQFSKELNVRGGRPAASSRTATAAETP